MPALTADRATPVLNVDGGIRPFGVAASTTIYAGALVAINASGYLVPMSATTGLTAVGTAMEAADNSGGANGDIACAVDHRIAQMVNNGTNSVAITDIGATVYAEDDQTVSTNSTGTSVAGTVWEYDATNDVVWVRFP